MALRNTLLAASLGATMVAGTSSEAKSDVPSSIVSAQTQTMNAREIQEMNFQKNYRHLYKNVDGAWFSFGDEKKLRQFLYDIASFPMGRELIAGLPENLEFGSTNFIFNSRMAGNYNARTNTLDVNARAMKLNDGTLGTMKEFIFHELLHAYQAKNIKISSEHPSVEEYMHSDKLGEAEAYGWNMALYATSTWCNGKYNMTPKQAKKLMTFDLVQFERSFCQKHNEPFDEQKFKNENGWYLLQQSLIACKGNYDLAQKKMVGEIIKKLMNGNEMSMNGWNEYYDNQALHNAKYYSKAGKLSAKGNAKAHQKMLDYYQDRYGLSSKDIGMNLGDNIKAQVHELKKQRGDFDSSSKLSMGVLKNYKYQR